MWPLGSLRQAVLSLRLPSVLARAGLGCAIKEPERWAAESCSPVDCAEGKARVLE